MIRFITGAAGMEGIDAAGRDGAYVYIKAEGGLLFGRKRPAAEPDGQLCPGRKFFVLLLGLLCYIIK